MKTELENATDREAAAWVVRLDGAPEDVDLKTAFEGWLGDDPCRQGAFIRAKAAWHALDPLRILPANSLQAPLEQKPTRRRMLLVGAGGVAAAACGSGFFLWRKGLIATPVGEIRRIPLADGSLMNVNTDTAVRVSLKDSLRQIRVERGEVWFQVAKDKARPFVVAAGPIRVRAVGTAFSVRRRDQGADVLVTEGIVETWSEDDIGRKTRLNAGSKVFVSDEFGPIGVVSAGQEIQRALAWREGEIALSGQTLGDAAQEFNRYNDRKLVIDPALSGEELDGWFRTNEPQTFAEAAAKTLGATVETESNEIRVVRRQ